VEAGIQQQFRGAPSPAAGELFDHAVADNLARHLFQLRVGQDEVKHVSTHLTSTKSYFRLEQKSMGSSMLDERISITLLAGAAAVIFRLMIVKKRG
jgi:hypothetical protein